MGLAWREVKHDVRFDDFGIGLLETLNSTCKYMKLLIDTWQIVQQLDPITACAVHISSSDNSRSRRGGIHCGRAFQ